MRTIVKTAPYIGRHILAIGGVIVLGCIFWTVTYFALLIWAILIGGGIGSPVAYPIGILVIIAIGLVASLILFLPSTLLGEFICLRCSLPTLIGIPISFIIFCALSFVWSFIAHFVFKTHIPSIMHCAAGLIVTLSVPLGLYWWVAEFPHVIKDAIKAVTLRLQRKKENTEPAAVADR